jgi:hypothetical protein
VFKPAITTNQLPQKEIQEKQDKPAKAAGQPDFNPSNSSRQLQKK